ncbi:9136_t:CDS:1 [Funneliformis geosporum]|nr:9136_t:CDS:1 [Funneliformis geosporum]
MESEDIERFRQQWRQEILQGQESRNDNVSNVQVVEDSLKPLEKEPLTIMISEESISISSKKDENNEAITLLIDSFRSMTLCFLPLNPRKKIHISKLPNELIIYILEQLIFIGGMNSMEIGFALVCKKFFLLSRETSLWRLLCEKTYCDNANDRKVTNKLMQECLTAYGGDWRRMYIER